MKEYYVIHVSSLDYPVPFIVETQRELNNDEILTLALEAKIIDRYDFDNIDYVEKISEVEYFMLLN